MWNQAPWALVTGASGEIGQAIACSLASQGIPLYLHYHQHADKVGQTLAFCRERGVNAYAIQADLSKPDQIAAMFQQMPVSPLLLVNNASIDHFGLVQDVTYELFDQMMAVNVRAAFFVTQAALPAMISRQFGRIVNMSSVWGMTGGACEVLYSLSKGALLAFTKALAKEVARCGVTVNAVAPGAIQGGMMGRFSPEETEAISESIPMGRLGTPQEVASLVTYLLTGDSAYLTGQVISPNGGWYM